MWKNMSFSSFMGNGTDLNSIQSFTASYTEIHMISSLNKCMSSLFLSYSLDQHSDHNTVTLLNNCSTYSRSKAKVGSLFLHNAFLYDSHPSGTVLQIVRYCHYWE